MKEIKRCMDLPNKFCDFMIQETADLYGIRIIFDRCLTCSIKSATEEKTSVKLF